MLPVYKGIFESEDVVIVVLIKLGVELNMDKPKILTIKVRYPYQIKDGHLHHTLVEICCLVLYHLHRNHFLCLQVLALNDLAKSALSKDIKNKVSISNRRVSIHYHKDFRNFILKTYL